MPQIHIRPKIGECKKHRGKNRDGGEQKKKQHVANYPHDAPENFSRYIEYFIRRAAYNARQNANEEYENLICRIQPCTFLFYPTINQS